jgi:DNA gyrase subunit A
MGVRLMNLADGDSVVALARNAEALDTNSDDIESESFESAQTEPTELESVEIEENGAGDDA